MRISNSCSKTCGRSPNNLASEPSPRAHRKHVAISRRTPSCGAVRKMVEHKSRYVSHSSGVAVSHWAPAPPHIGAARGCPAEVRASTDCGCRASAQLVRMSRAHPIQYRALAGLTTLLTTRRLVRWLAPGRTGGNLMGSVACPACSGGSCWASGAHGQTYVITVSVEAISLHLRDYCVVHTGDGPSTTG